MTKSNAELTVILSISSVLVLVEIGWYLSFPSSMILIRRTRRWSGRSSSSSMTRASASWLSSQSSWWPTERRLWAARGRPLGTRAIAWWTAAMPSAGRRRAAPWNRRIICAGRRGRVVRLLRWIWRGWNDEFYLWWWLMWIVCESNLLKRWIGKDLVLELMVVISNQFISSDYVYWDLYNLVSLSFTLRILWQ